MSEIGHLWPERARVVRATNGDVKVTKYFVVSHTPEIKPLQPNVWEYTNYQDYLRDYLAHKRSTTRGFSVRQFCLKANISTENYLLKVIRGEKKLGPKLTESFIAAIPLKAFEAQYFRALVSLRLAKHPHEKENVLSKIEVLRRKSKRPQPVMDHSILRHWYLAAIWELASCVGIEINPQSIVNSLRKKISLQQAKESIEYLQQKGYLIEKKGKLIQSDIPVISSDGKLNYLLKTNHKETLALAIPAVDLPLDERGFYGLTMAIDKKKIPEIKSKIKFFMDQLQAELALDPKANTVVRINSHVYPLTK